MLEGGRRITGTAAHSFGGKTYLGVDEGGGKQEGGQDGHGATHGWIVIGW